MEILKTIKSKKPKEQITVNAKYNTASHENHRDEFKQVPIKLYAI
jgi:hypothetical protein